MARKKTTPGEGPGKADQPGDGKGKAPGDGKAQGRARRRPADAESKPSPPPAPAPKAKPPARPKAKSKAKPPPDPPAPAPRPKVKPAPAPAPAPTPAPKAVAKGKAKAKGSSAGKGKTPAKPRGKRGGSMSWADLEAAMWQALGHADAPDTRPGSPRDKALKALQKAFETFDPAEAAAHAKEALAAWPDCTDAYVLLAETSYSPKEAADLYARGVAAAERELGEAAFANAAGMFWKIFPTRPYMRARLGLAQTLWVLGRREEAVTHYRELLRLNPTDNQGVRYLLAGALLQLDRDEELAALMHEYVSDDSATWNYTWALLYYRLEGNNTTSRSALSAARKVNKYVPEYLTGKTMLPSRMPDEIEPGARSEAVDYAAGFLNAWRGTPGALDWLRTLGRRPRSKPAAKKAVGPTAASKAELAALPRAEDTWQADFRRLPVWVNTPGEPQRPWVVLVAALDSGMVLGQQVFMAPPTAGELWDTVAAVMRSPGDDGEPRRPAAIEVGSDSAWEAITEDLEGLGLVVEAPGPLELIDEMIRHLTEHVTGRPPLPGLLEMPGVSPEHVGRFFEAAAEFYRRAPWQRVGGAETVKVACNRFESGPWYAVVIGQMGMTLGVALYEDLSALLRIRDGDSTDEQNARETVALSVTYGRASETTVADLEAAESFGWDVAAPDAYPTPIRKERGLTMRPPLVWELRLLEAVLRSLPDFIEQHDRDDPTTFTRTVPTAGGDLPVELSWVGAGPPLA